MSSLLPGFEYDIFISYRHKDNKGGHWVTDFVDALKTELDATFKEDISIYFDENPADGLLATYDVSDSLKDKLKSLIFIPIISHTYCDPKSFAWTNEFLAFKKIACGDSLGLKIKLRSGNVASRILPVRIHEIDVTDLQILEDELQGKLRAIDFIYHLAGVNRPLTPNDQRDLKLNKFLYRDQINKVANSVKEIILAVQHVSSPVAFNEEKQQASPKGIPFKIELNRRNVLKTTLASLLFSLLFWKVASISIELFDLPARTLKVVTLILIIFFPVSIVMAWLFERSPQGFIRTGTTVSISNPFSPDQKKPFTSNYFILLLLATAIALFSFFPPDWKSTDETGIQLDGVEPSLAVVPFDNLSKDSKQDYISDGMMEAILSHLFKIQGLRLTSRTTMMTYKGTKKTIPEIADEVGVRFVLEGSVQRVGDTIRINAQLIDAHTDNHIWAEYYDRKLSDLLSIQSEVAQQIANILEVKIKPATKAIIDQIPTSNTEAYDLYLRAVHMRYDVDSLEQYRVLVEKAIALDPQFASPYAELGSYWIAQSGLTSQEIIQKAEPLFNKAISLNPSETWAHINLGYLNLFHKWDFYAAEREFNYAAQLEPSNLAAMDTDVKVAMGRFSEAVKLARQRMIAEPNDKRWKVYMGFTLYFNGQHSEAMVFLDSASRAGPLTNVMDEAYARSDLGRAYLYLGKDKRVMEVLEKVVMKSSSMKSAESLKSADGIAEAFQAARLKAILAIALVHLGKHERATQLLIKIKEQSIRGPVGSPSFYAAMVYAQLGKPDSAFLYLDKSFAEHEIEMFWLKVEPPFKPLHNDPRWQTMLDKVGFPKEPGQ